MPVAALVCPHCEKPVELQVTGVTRSRPCPHCQKHIMLQFTQKQGRVKRKALLVNAKGGLDFDAMKGEGPLEEPQPLMGDAFERMRADPELIAIKKRFAWSAGVVAALVVLATIIHLNRDRWFPQAKKPPPVAVAADESVESAKPVKKDTNIATAQRPEKKQQKLDFMLADKPAVAIEEPARFPQRPALPPPARINAGKNPIPGANIGPPVSSTGPKSRGATTTASAGDMMGTLPKSLFRISRKPGVVVDHDLTKAKAVLAGFLSAPNVSQRLQFVADHASVEPRLRAFYVQSGDGPVAFMKITGSEVLGDGSVSEHDVILPNGRVWRASVVKSPDGAYQVDWPSFVAESEVSWPELMAKKSSRPTMLRVAAVPGSYFEGDFADAKWLTCLKLTHPNHPELPPIFAYVEKQSVLGREMETWMKEGEGQAMPMTVRVKYPVIATADNQVWLSDLVTPGWVVRAGLPVVEAKGMAGGISK